MFNIITDYCITSINRYSTLATIINYVSPLLTTITEGSLEAKLPTIWTDGKAEVGRVREEKRREMKRREEKRNEEKRNEEKRNEEKRREEK